MLRQELHSGNTYVRLVADLGHLSPVVVPITALCAAYEGQLLCALPEPRGLWLQSRINGFTLRTCLARIMATIENQRLYSTDLPGAEEFTTC